VWINLDKLISAALASVQLWEEYLAQTEHQIASGHFHITLYNTIVHWAIFTLVTSPSGCVLHFTWLLGEANLYSRFHQSLLRWGSVPSPWDWIHIALLGLAHRSINMLSLSNKDLSSQSEFLLLTATAHFLCVPAHDQLEVSGLLELFHANHSLNYHQHNGLQEMESSSGWHLCVYSLRICDCSKHSLTVILNALSASCVSKYIWYRGFFERRLECSLQRTLILHLAPMLQRNGIPSQWLPKGSVQVTSPKENKSPCIITATAPATLAVAMLATLTPDYKVLTNQGDAPVSVYIDSIALQLNLSHHSNKHRILYILHASEYNSTVLFSDINTN
jgi:hypothetical protein